MNFEYSKTIAPKLAGYSPELVDALEAFADRAGCTRTPRTDNPSFEARLFDVLGYLPNGFGVITLDKTVAASGAASYAFGTIPSGAKIIAADLTLAATVTATTAVKIGIGTAADPDKYGKTSALTAATYNGFLATPVILTSADTVIISAVDTAGDAAGTLNAGSIRGRIIYQSLPPLS